MSPFGHRCTFCGLYVKFWHRSEHEAWHAGQVVEITKLLCSHCFQEHTKSHAACGKYPKCRCSCNAWGALPEGGEQ